MVVCFEIGGWVQAYLLYGRHGETVLTMVTMVTGASLTFFCAYTMLQHLCLSETTLVHAIWHKCVPAHLHPFQLVFSHHVPACCPACRLLHFRLRLCWMC